MGKKKEKLTIVEIKASRHSYNDVMAIRRASGVKVKPREWPHTTGSICSQIGEFLMWARGRYPGMIILHTEIAQALSNVHKLPTINDDSTVTVRKCMSRVKDYLLHKYKLGVATCRCVGCRVSLDHADMAVNCANPARARVLSAHEGFKRTTDCIDPAKVRERANNETDPATKAEFEKAADWLEDVVHLHKVIAQPAMQRALQGPVPDLEEDGEKGGS